MELDENKNGLANRKVDRREHCDRTKESRLKLGEKKLKILKYSLP